MVVRSANQRLMSCLVILACLIVLGGCSQKFTRDRFAMIEVGVDEEEDVREMLGKPEAVLADVWYYEDFRGHVHAQVFFDTDGRVLAKEWGDANTGEWDGSNPHANEPPTGEVRERHTKTRRYDD